MSVDEIFILTTGKGQGMLLQKLRFVKVCDKTMTRKVIHEDDDCKIFSFKKYCHISQNLYFLQFKSRNRKFIKPYTETLSVKKKQKYWKPKLSVSA